MNEQQDLLVSVDGVSIFVSGFNVLQVALLKQQRMLQNKMQPKCNVPM